MRVISILTRLRNRLHIGGRQAEDRLHVDTELMRRRRELTRSQGQAGHNLTVQTTIDMART